MKPIPAVLPQPTGLRPRAGRAESDAGFVGGFAGLLFGVAIFVIGTLLAAYAWSVVETKAATSAAAREAARSYIAAPSPEAGSDAARLAALSALSGRVSDPSKASVALDSGAFGRCQRITISVAYPAPALQLPLVRRIGPLGGKVVRAEHSELIDPYRTGIAGSARCA
ncbi:MAG TPA: hypothetical protein VFV02_11985 [Acidimicrobiales bacterium]|nr:hypothetical protein [Acidimicrobiales bacterium]